MLVWILRPFWHVTTFPPLKRKAIFTEKFHTLAKLGVYKFWLVELSYVIVVYYHLPKFTLKIIAYKGLALSYWLKRGNTKYFSPLTFEPQPSIHIDFQDWGSQIFPTQFFINVFPTFIYTNIVVWVSQHKAISQFWSGFNENMLAILKFNRKTHMALILVFKERYLYLHPKSITHPICMLSLHALCYGFIFLPLMCFKAFMVYNKCFYEFLIWEP